MKLSKLSAQIQKALVKEIKGLVKKRKLTVGERVKIQGMVTHFGIKIKALSYQVNKRLVLPDSLTADDLKRISEIPSRIHLTDNQCKLLEFFVNSNNQPIKHHDLWVRNYRLVNAIATLNIALRDNNFPFAVSTFKKEICFRKIALPTKR